MRPVAVSLADTASHPVHTRQWAPVTPANWGRAWTKRIGGTRANASRCSQRNRPAPPCTCGGEAGRFMLHCSNPAAGGRAIKTVASYNIKGGVGKTAIAVNLARSSLASRHRTLLWDLDEQGGASTILGHMPAIARRRVRRTYQLTDHITPSAWTGLDLIPADALLHLVDRHDRPRHLRELLQRIASSYDRVIVDCPPTLGLLTEQIFEMADLIIVPVVPSSLSMTALAQLQAYAQGRDRPSPELLPVFSMVDRRRTAHREALEAAPKQTAIPYAAAMERMAATGLPIAEIAPGSPAARSLAALWKAAEKRLAKSEK